jgi:hypothetical protein
MIIQSVKKVTEPIICPKCGDELQEETEDCPNCKPTKIEEIEDSKIKNYSQKIKSKLKETNTIIFLVGSVSALILAVLFIIDVVDSMMGGGPFDSLVVIAGILLGICLIMIILGLNFIQRIITKSKAAKSSKLLIVSGTTIFSMTLFISLIVVIVGALLYGLSYFMVLLFGI